jgi:hypothetical protein
MFLVPKTMPENEKEGAPEADGELGVSASINRNILLNKNLTTR